MRVGSTARGATRRGQALTKRPPPRAYLLAGLLRLPGATQLRRGTTNGYRRQSDPDRRGRDPGLGGEHVHVGREPAPDRRHPARRLRGRLPALADLLVELGRLRRSARGDRRPRSVLEIFRQLLREERAGVCLPAELGVDGGPELAQLDDEPLEALGRVE